MVMTIVGVVLVVMAMTAILFWCIHGALMLRKETRMPDEKKEPRRFMVYVNGQGGGLDLVSVSELRELMDQVRAELDHRGYIRRVAGEKTDG